MEDLLEAYASERLTPRGPVLARMRAHVLAEAQAVSADRVPTVTRDTDSFRRDPWSLARFSMRRLAIRPARVASLVGASMLVIVGSTAVLAAPAGSPLFDVRVAVGSAFLPGEVDDRLS